MVEQAYVKGALCRSNPPLSHHAESSDSPRNWRHRGSSNYFLAGANGRDSQLGLPVLLDPRRYLHTIRAHRVWFHGRSQGLARLAAPRCGWKAGSYADHVRYRWRAASHGVRTGGTSRLRSVSACKSWKRRLWTVAARCLWRVSRLPLPGSAQGTAKKRGRLGTGKSA